MFTQFASRPEPFKDPLAQFTYVRTYSRFLPDKQRRETWFETAQRYCEFLVKAAARSGWALPEPLANEIFCAVYDHDVVGSMRLLWSAGPAAEMNNVTAYNCSFAAVNSPLVFDEALFILMCGTGFGGSVEYEYIEELPRIIKPRSGARIPDTHVIDDSREGWATALRQGIDRWYHGHDITYDFSRLRPAGARLRTMGGRSSGPEPLKRLLSFTRDKFRERAGRRLQTIDCADILCMVAEIVEMGGVRRSSEICLFSPDDPLMLKAKRGAFYNQHPYRKMANNSLAYDSRPSNTEFLNQWMELAEGGSGEPGLFIKSNARITAPRRDRWSSWGTNPCGEIVLRGDHPSGGGQFCNLSEAVLRPSDDAVSMARKIRLATIIGTIQSTLTSFPYLRPGWKENCEAERLLGVSMTGMADNASAFDPQILASLRQLAIDTNHEYAPLMGIAPSAAITCVKPSGTTSLTVGSASGMHRRWSQYYIRRQRISATDPLLQFARRVGIPCEPEVGQDPVTATTWVLSFPTKAPEGAKTRKDVTAIQQLDDWLKVKTYYCEHNPSCTVYVKQDEWISSAAWLDSNWSKIGGLSFLPFSDHVYRLAPYEEITEEQYNEMMRTFPAKFDFTQLAQFEKEDATFGGGNGCEGGLCELPTSA